MRKLILAATAYLSIVGIALAGGAFPPFDGDYGLRGDFNDWSLTAMDWDEASSTYSVTTFVDAGNWNFKISDIDWSDPITFGNDGSIGTITPDAVVGVDLAAGFNTDLNLDILTAGNYLFELDLSGWTNTGALDAVLSVSQVVVPVPAAGFLLLSAIAGLRLFRRKG